MSAGSETLGWLVVMLIFGSIIFAAVFVIIGFESILYWTNDSVQEKINISNSTYHEVLDILSNNYTIYQSRFKTSEPYLEVSNLTEFINLLTIHKKTALLTNEFQKRQGIPYLSQYYSGYFWFTFQDNNIEVQCRYTINVVRNNDNGLFGFFPDKNSTSGETQ